MATLMSRDPVRYRPLIPVAVVENVDLVKLSRRTLRNVIFNHGGFYGNEFRSCRRDVQSQHRYR